MNIPSLVPSLVVACFLGNTSVQAQGTLWFSNVPLNSPVLGALADEWSAELWVGRCPDVLLPVSASVTTFSIDHYFLGGSVVIPGFPPGSHPWVQIRVWDNQGGTITDYTQASELGVTNGVSRVFQLASGLGKEGAAEPPPPMIPFGSPGLLADPPFRVLTTHCIHQGALVLNIARQGPADAPFTLLTSTNLSSPVDWRTESVIPQERPSTVVSIPLMKADGARFYRVAQEISE